jgi:lycopene cyclase domain-containing protein
MTYTQLALTAVGVAVLLDLAVLRVRLLRRGAFWTAYGIVFFFQLVTNGWLTAREVVTYDPAAIIGSGGIPFVGDGRLAFAPVEDLMFGFAMILLTLDLWVWWGRRGVEREPAADGPWSRRYRPELDATGAGRERPRRAASARR